MNNKPQSGENLVVAKRPSPQGAKAKRKGGGPLPGTQSQSGVQHLSERAQGVLHRLLDEQVEANSIAQVVWLQTRERVSTAAITRYASRYRKRRREEQGLRDKLDALLARAHQDGIRISDLLRSFLLEKLSQAQRDGSLKKADFLKLEDAARRRGEFELKQQQAQLSAAFRERELQLKERNTTIAEGRFRLDRKKAKALVAALEQKAGAGRRLTSVDVSKVREMYGLCQGDAEINDEEAHTAEAI